MAVTKIRGNQINTATQAVIDRLTFLDGESILRLPSGTTAEQPTGISVGTLRFNTTLDSAEIYVADADGAGNPGWTSVGGGGTSVGNDGLIRTNDTTLTESAIVGPSAGSEFTHGFCVGPLTVASGSTLTVETNGKLLILD